MSDRQGVYVLGAGGHAKVVISTLHAAGYRIQTVYDDDSSKWGQACLGITIQGPLSEIEDLHSPEAVIAIGSNAVRKQIAGRLPHARWVTVVHPRAVVDNSVKLAPGTVVFAGAVVQPETVVGVHTIINTGVTVDHECCIGDYVHIAPGTHLAGGVHLKEGVFLGIGSAVTPNVVVGAWSRVGAGGVVVSDLPTAVLAVGVPARKIREIEPYG